LASGASFLAIFQILILFVVFVLICLIAMDSEGSYLIILLSFWQPRAWR